MVRLTEKVILISASILRFSQTGITISIFGTGKKMGSNLSDFLFAARASAGNKAWN